MTHKGKKDALDAESKRKEGVRNAVEPAVAAYEEAKKALKKTSGDRRAAVKASNDPPPTVGVWLSLSLSVMPTNWHCTLCIKCAVEMRPTCSIRLWVCALHAGNFNQFFVGFCGQIIVFSVALSQNKMGTSIARAAVHVVVSINSVGKLAILSATMHPETCPAYKTKHNKNTLELVY